ncbi:MAG: hypothetical protein LBH68_00360, partial [Bifidobacteriaceae bacterium]|nr:hypothetical protein [Bifidobacteriaceae bacterium]
MAEIVLLTADSKTPGAALPALEFLPHKVRVMPLESLPPEGLRAAELVVLDARQDLQVARRAARLLRVTNPAVPLVLVVTEGALTAVTEEWGARDFVLAGASPAEVEARIRLATAALNGSVSAPDEAIVHGNLVINPISYTVKLHGRSLDLTYKEFELLRYLAANPD